MQSTLGNLLPASCLRQGSALSRCYSSIGNGIKYFGFTYYPRFPDHKDPPIQPAKFFMIKRIRCLKKKPYWEKNIMREFGLDEKRSKVVIVKNIPDVNHRLWQVKHLIRITPITFPNGEPTEEDIGSACLKENGECIITPKLKVDQELLEEDKEKARVKLDGLTLQKVMRYNWLNPRF